MQRALVQTRKFISVELPTEARVFRMTRTRARVVFVQEAGYKRKKIQKADEKNKNGLNIICTACFSDKPADKYNTCQTCRDKVSSLRHTPCARKSQMLPR